jgi:hypothetical protein
MRQLILFIIAGILAILLASPLKAQSVSISPYSFNLWGKSVGMIEISARDFNTGFHYFMPTDTSERLYKDEPSRLVPAFAVSYAFRWKAFEFGPMLFDRPFPIVQGSRLNFFIDLGFEIGSVRISYKHVSNGFGLMNPMNPGVDSLTIRIGV